MGPKALSAVLKHFEAEKEKAEATLIIFANNPMGVGGHPNIVDDLIKVVEDLSRAEGGIAITKNLLASNKKK